ncbi:MAG: hypothetical protein R2911_28435 [Caldilineaceae bacterium]
MGGIARTTAYSYLPFNGQGYLVSQVIDLLGPLLLLTTPPATCAASPTRWGA